MRQKLSVFVFFLFLCCTCALAQEWSKEDSLWLQNVLEGKELKINEETKKAIEEGRLIVPSWMKRNDDLLDPELVKEFDNNGRVDSVRISRLDPYSMPPAVFALYVLYLEKLDSAFYIESIMISPEERKKLEKLLPTGTLRTFYTRTAGSTPGVGISIDFNDLLSMVFNARYRRIKHNSKHATAYKGYYDAGGIKKPFRLTELERKQINQSVNSIKTSLNVSAGPRRGGIDN